ncbi:hypothetical protein HGG64_01060 [Mycoplasma phocoeninasale]|uniref:Uncharacterized protein n=1 Tax=Mycoplasma phocoeninasale TaxID=2726117 RepID=A0A858U1M7_9MOLU|nr:hypothetical protein [Mycoplasma phocoeninasale]QJG66302.1 hypothetical protein HGG64_01060 [Mycoplasma phocoeninasale]
MYEHFFIKKITKMILFFGILSILTFTVWIVAIISMAASINDKRNIAAIFQGAVFIIHLILIFIALRFNILGLKIANADYDRRAVKWFWLAIIFFPVAFFFSIVGWKRLKDLEKNAEFNKNNYYLTNQNQDLSNSI